MWDIHTSQRIAEKQFCWSSFEVTIAKDIVIIVPCTWPQPCPICVWDLRSNQANAYGSFSNLWLWHANADENVLVTLEINWDTHPPEVQQKKWALTSRELIDQKHFHLSLRGRRVEMVGRPFRAGIDGIRNYGHKTIIQLYRTRVPNATMHLMYDYAVDRLSVQWIDCVDPINEQTIWGGCGFLGTHITYRWAHQRGGVAIYNAVIGSTTVRPYQLPRHPRN